MIDAIYCISLERLDERRKRSIELLSQLNFCSVFFLDAIDATKYTIKNFNDIGVFTYDNWEIKDDSWRNIPMYSYGKERIVHYQYWIRPVTIGEIACTLGHYMVWKHCYENNFERCLILEDDISFQLDNFLDGLNIFSDFCRNNFFDIFYLGCISWLDGEKINSNVIECKFAYQLHAYILTQNACNILINSGLLENLIVSDEYVPAIIGYHPREDLKRIYNPIRNLVSYRLIEEVVSQSDFGSHTAIDRKEKFGLMKK